MLRTILVTVFILVAACTGRDGDTSTAPTTPVAALPASAVEAPTPVETANTNAPSIPSISSVQLVQDCPDPEPEATPNAAEETSVDPPVGHLARPDGSGPCTQSHIQMAFTGAGALGQKVQLMKIRLLSIDGETVHVLAARMPSRWGNRRYQSWNEVLNEDTEQKVSYKLSVPDWRVVEKAIGGSSFKAMFILEVDVLVHGTTTTLRSPQFERGSPLVVRT